MSGLKHDEPTQEPNAPGDVTQLLRRLDAGDKAAIDELFKTVYETLRTHAKFLERPGVSLTATALVHEAYIKLVKGGGFRATDRQHFYNLARETMTHLRIDYWNSKTAEKRGGQRTPEKGGDAPNQFGVDKTAGPAKTRRGLVPRKDVYDVDPATGDDPADLLVVRDAIDNLKKVNARAAEVFCLRYFGGFTTEEVAAEVDLSARQVRRIMDGAVEYIAAKLEWGKESI